VKRALKLAAVLAAAVALAWAFRVRDGRVGPRLERGAIAPPLRLPALSGGEVDLQALRGQLVLVNFWATWCPPCVQEMPSLEKLHRTLGGQGLTVLGVSVDEDEAALRAFVQRAGVSFPILRDPGGRGPSAAYFAAGYPESYVLDPQGRVLESYIGPAEWATPEAIDHFRELLARFEAPEAPGKGPP
jgi:peroxiredoxin